jgi:serine protease Do
MKKYLIIIIAASIINFSAQPAFAAKELVQMASFADIIEPLMPAVVNIYTVKYHNRTPNKNRPLPDLVPFEEFSDFFKEFNVPFMFDLYSSRASSLGSGFIIDETGLIVTNYHVIAGSDEIHVKLADNSEFPARIIGRDPKTDLALIKIDTDGKLPFVSFGNSSNTRVGDVVIAIGNSLGFGGTVTSGIISSKSRDLGSGADELVDDFIQTDAAINTGNSGGPLFNVDGKVIGINTSIPAVAGGTNVGIGFAIPSNRAQNIVEQLKKSGKITRGRLDIAIQEINKELSEALNIKQDYGVLVVDSKTGGAGQKAGLQRGDIITEFNDKKVTNSRKLQLFVAETNVGDEIKLTILRNGEKMDLKAVISEVEDEGAIETGNPNISPKKMDGKNLTEKSGVIFSDLTPELIDQFNIDKTIKGIVVISAKTKDIKPNLIAGDVIIAINQEPTEDTAQFSNIYEKLKSSDKKSAILLVKRGELSMFIALPIR